MAEGNGEYVTRRELYLITKPIEDNVGEIKADVKTLLAAQAGSRALSTYQRWLFGTVFIGILAILATLLVIAQGK